MRSLRITESFGLYKVEADGWESAGASLESALIKAWRKANLNFQGALDDPEFPEVRNQFDMAEVLETLMGRDRQSGQIHEGVQSG